ncbi:hypothetical protein L1887_33962 [Cichorium endivia]|nr:hypothetical protein L1887_33962 [Cichorium endivia]
MTKEFIEITNNKIEIHRDRHDANAIEEKQPAENAANRCDDAIRVTAGARERKSDIVRVTGPSRIGNRIKSVRPPVLSPPSSSISKPLIHHDTGSEWGMEQTHGLYAFLNLHPIVVDAAATVTPSLPGDSEIISYKES